MTECLPPDDNNLIQVERKEYREYETTLTKSKLKIVRLSRSGCTEAMLGYLVKNTSLEEVYVDGCQIGDDGVLAIGMNCPDLRVLDLSGCRVTDCGLQSLAVHLSDSWRREVDESGLGYNDFGSFKKPKRTGSCPLKVLILSGCVDLTSRGVQLVARKCPNLKTIVLDGCPKVTDWYLGSSEEDGPRYEKPESLAINDDSDTASYVSDDGWNSPMMEKKMRRLSVSRKQILDK